MRQSQQKNRMRGRGRKPSNPTNRSYESNGPDVKIRGNALHIAEKYTQLARDAHSAGDRVMAENYLQHAEHYNRIVAATQPQLIRSEDSLSGRSSQPGYDQDGDEEDDNENQPDQLRPVQGGNGAGRDDDDEDDYDQPQPRRADYQNNGRQQSDRQNNDRQQARPQYDRQNNDRQNQDRQGNDRQSNDRQNHDRQQGDRQNTGRQGAERQPQDRQFQDRQSHDRQPQDRQNPDRQQVERPVQSDAGDDARRQGRSRRRSRFGEGEGSSGQALEAVDNGREMSPSVDNGVTDEAKADRPLREERAPRAAREPRGPREPRGGRNGLSADASMLPSSLLGAVAPIAPSEEASVDD